MKHRKWLIWYGILHKRLLKKISFLLILLIIPVIAFLAGKMGADSGGLVRVAAAPENGWGPLSQEMVDTLQQKNGMIAVTACQTRQQAIDMVLGAKADTAWIFAENLQEKLDRRAAGEKVTLIQVFAAEENTFARASREKLFSVLFREISYRMFEMTAQETDFGLSSTELRAVFDSYDYPEGLVDFVFLDDIDHKAPVSYLTSPLRGLMAAVMLLSGMAAVMYWKKDEKNRVFAMLEPKMQVLPLFFTVFAALFMTGLVVTAALILSGVYTDFARETLTMALFVLSATGFCCLLGVLCPGNAALGAALPLVLLAAVGLCPVFINIRSAFFVQILLPPYHYLYSVGDLSRLWGAAAYCLATLGAVWLLFPRRKLA